MCAPPGVAPWASIPGKHTDAGAGGDGGDSLLIEMFRGGNGVFLPTLNSSSRPSLSWGALVL